MSQKSDFLFSPTALNHLLNQEEISFLMRPNVRQGTDNILKDKIKARKEFRWFSEKLTSGYKKELSDFIHAPLSISLFLPEKGKKDGAQLYFKLGNVICSIDEEDAVRLVSVALKNPQSQHFIQLNGISLNILSCCLQRLAKVLRQISSELVPSSEIKILKTAENHNHGLHLLLKIEIEQYVIRLNLAFKNPTIQDFLPTAKLKIADIKLMSQDISAGISAKKIRLTAQTKTFSMPLSQVLDWQKGTFIPLKMKPDEEINLCTRGISPLKAVIGQKNAHIAVKLTTEVKKK